MESFSQKDCEVIVVGLNTLMTIATIATGGLVGGIYALYQMQKNKSNANGMKPSTLGDFQITTAQEGACVPMVYGRCKITGNIIFYGNLTSEEVTESVGGKGMGGGGEATGYKYYLDVWQALCEGPCEILATYSNETVYTVEATDTIENDGTEATFPTWAGEYASALPGISHIAYQQWYIGENVTTVPTLHFIVRRNPLPFLSYSANSDGVNPAAIIFEILLKKTKSTSYIDIASFNAAATFWDSKGYYLSLPFSQKEDPEQMIQRVLQFVDGAVYLNTEGKYAISAFDPADTPVTTISQEDFIEFEFNRSSYYDLPNSFQGTFTDADNNYTDRVVVSTNAAVQDLVGYKIQETIDLSAFTTVAAASKRIVEIKKRRSYPAATISFTADLRYELLNVGDVVTVSHSDYGIVSVDFRVTSVEYTTIDENTVKISAEQVVEGLFDDEYDLAGGTEWVDPDVSLVTSTKLRVFELPWNRMTEDKPSYLLLVAREKYETSFDLYFSTTGTDYEKIGNKTTFSLEGSIDEEYPNTTNVIDDVTGILFTPFRFDPAFGSISRTDLFYRRRIAIIGSEIMSFQTITPEGLSSYRLTGVVRGALGTEIQTHAASATIWITNISEQNILQDVATDHFYVKFVTRCWNRALAITDATAVEVTCANKAKYPGRVRVVATRTSATNVDVTTFPTIVETPGAGYFAEDMTIPLESSLEEVLLISENGGAYTEKYTTDFSLALVGPNDTIDVKHSRNGFDGEVTRCDIGSSLQSYYGYEV